MKIQKEKFGEKLQYVGVCILTGGFAWFMRIVLTTSIKRAFKEE